MLLTAFKQLQLYLLLSQSCKMTFFRKRIECLKMCQESISHHNLVGNKTGLKNWKKMETFFSKKNLSNTEFSWISKYGLTFIVSLKSRFVTQAFLQAQRLKLAIFFNKFAFPYLNYSYSKIHILSKLPIIESSLPEQLNL